MNGKGIRGCLLLIATLTEMHALPTTPEPACTLGELQRCLESLQSHTNDLTSAVTRSELERLCSTLQESVSCVDGHMLLCFNPTQRKVFNSVVAGARQVLEELCVPGKIQEAYLRFAPCFRNVSLSERKCAPKYRDLLELSENVDRREDVDQGLRESCCAFVSFVSCQYEHVGRDCGPEATLFLQRHLDRISSPLLQEHCALYTHARDACSPSGGTKGVPHAWILLAWICIYCVTSRRRIMT